MCEVKLDCCGWSDEGEGGDLDEGRVAGERRPGFNFLIELFASPRDFLNGGSAV